MQDMNIRLNFALLGCLGISFLLWFGIKLQQKKMYTIPIKIGWECAGKSNGKQKSILYITFEDTNAQLARYVWRKDSAEVVVKGCEYLYFTTHSFKNDIIENQKVIHYLEAYFNGVGIQKIELKTPFLEHQLLKSKRIPVLLNTTLIDTANFKIQKPIFFAPDSITIQAPSEIIDTFNYCYTAPLKINAFNTTFADSLPLLLPPAIQINNPDFKIGYKIKVSQVIEKQIDNIPIQIIGEQEKNTKIQFFPSHISIKCKVNVEDFDNITNKSFQVGANAVNLGMEHIKTVEPFIITQLPIAKQCAIIPQQVEYLIEY